MVCSCVRENRPLTDEYICGLILATKGKTESGRWMAGQMSVVPILSPSPIRSLSNQTYIVVLGECRCMEWPFR